VGALRDQARRRTPRGRPRVRAVDRGQRAGRARGGLHRRGGGISFGAFTAGVEKEYTASTTATVISTAADATLSVDGGTLANGAFALRTPLEGTGVLKTWDAPASNAIVPITFRQKIGATEPLRTGSYAKTLTFTLSTTAP
jgi:hypothetical protein